VRYEERGQGHRDVEKVGKHWSKEMRVKCIITIITIIIIVVIVQEKGCFV